MISGWPAVTCSPVRTWTAMTVPGIGLRTSATPAEAAVVRAAGPASVRAHAAPPAPSQRICPSRAYHQRRLCPCTVTSSSQPSPRVRTVAGWGSPLSMPAPTAPASSDRDNGRSVPVAEGSRRMLTVAASRWDGRLPGVPGGGPVPAAPGVAAPGVAVGVTATSALPPAGSATRQIRGAGEPPARQPLGVSHRSITGPAGCASTSRARP